MPAPGPTRPERAWQIPIAVLTAALVAGSVALWSVKERDRTSADRVAPAAALADAGANGDVLPITRDMSVAACNRSGGMAAGCIGSETSLRQPAFEVWRSASAADRKECLDAAARAPEPVGALYTCLRSKERVGPQLEDRRRSDDMPASDTGRGGAARSLP